MGKSSGDLPKRSAGAGRSGTAGARPTLQVGALCWRRTKKGALRVLLITSRDTGRWVIPKGWPMRRRSEAEAAAREAWEEAGVRGDVAEESLGLYSYSKIMLKGWSVPVVVRVFAFEVRSHAATFPEAGQRRRRWFSPAKAAGRVQEPDLARIIRNFDPDAERAGARPPDDADPSADREG